MGEKSGREGKNKQASAHPKIFVLDWSVVKKASDLIHSVNEKQSLIMTFHICPPSDTVILSNF